MAPSRATRTEILQGTLDLLILQTLLMGPSHGHAIAKQIQRTSEDVLQVQHGSLYPALQRLERRKLIAGKWLAKGGSRPLKVYALTPEGRRRLVDETSRWELLVRAVTRILRPA